MVFLTNAACLTGSLVGGLLLKELDAVPGLLSRLEFSCAWALWLLLRLVSSVLAMLLALKLLCSGLGMRSAAGEARVKVVLTTSVLMVEVLAV